MGDVPTASCACRSKLRAGAACAAVQGTRGPFLLPARGLLPTSLGCPSPTAVGKASNATSCEDPAHRAPPTHPPTVWASRRKYSAAPSPRTPCPGPANLPLTLTGALTIIALTPPSFYSPRPSLGRPLHNFPLPQNQAPQAPFRTLASSP